MTMASTASSALVSTTVVMAAAPGSCKRPTRALGRSRTT
jgi:hypothetical protein